MRNSRQNFMLDEFLKDTNQQKIQQNIWAMFGATDSTEQGISGDSLARVFAIVKNDIHKIKSRGGTGDFCKNTGKRPYEYTTRISYKRSGLLGSHCL
jgi:hypothetical protein